MKLDRQYSADLERVASVIPQKEKLFHKRIFITGASGMVCSTVAELLAYLNRHEQAGITILLGGRSEERIRQRFQYETVKYEYVHFDATEDTELSVDADYIIHGAGNANPRLYATEPVETMIGNIRGMDRILRNAVKHPGCRVLFVSSSEVYGKKEHNNPFSENEYGYVDCLSPRSCYPNGKRAAETLCACYLDEHGVDFVIARLGHIYGPSITSSDTRATAEFTRNALNGRPIVMKSAGAQLRSYCYTLDCASALLTVLTAGTSGEAYNISNSGSIVSIREMASLFAKAAGVNVIYENPSDLELKGYTTMPNSSLKSDKLEALGWKAVFPAEEGVARTMQVVRSGI